MATKKGKTRTSAKKSAVRKTRVSSRKPVVRKTRVSYKKPVIRTIRVVEKQPVVYKVEETSTANEAARQAVTPAPPAPAPKPVEKQHNWGWIVGGILMILLILLCCLPFWGIIFGFRFNAPATPAVKPTTIVLVQPTAAAIQPTVAVQPTAQPTAVVQPTVQSAQPTTQSAGTGSSSAFADMANYSISGAPTLVNSANVLFANGKDNYGNTFTNTTGIGTQMMFAEPGTLLVGPDFDANIVKNSGGHIEYISPITQQMLGTDTFATNTAEGAFTWATGAKMTIEVGNFTIKVESKDKACTNNWFVVIRGLFADGKQNSDRNTTTHFSNYVAGHTQVMWYPAGAYISEGNFKQVAELSHTDGRNCGHEGTSGLSVLMLDLNTGAYDVIYQANTGQPWQFVASNWYK